MYFFDGQTGEHILNYKFKKTRVIDLDSEWQNPQLSLSSAFVKSACLAELRFDTRLKYAEDAQLILKILSDKHRLGVVCEAAYLYRKRSAGEASAIQSGTTKKAWYIDYMQKNILDSNTGNYIGLSKFAYTTQPPNSDNFKYPIEIEICNEPENIFEEIQAIIEVLKKGNQ